MSFTHTAASKKYADAVWDYVLEHSDIAPGGTLFVKFHTKSKNALDGHIQARIRGYHRGDPREREVMLQNEEERSKAMKAATKAKAEQKRLEKKARKKGVTLPIEQQREALKKLHKEPVIKRFLKLFA